MQLRLIGSLLAFAPLMSQAGTGWTNADMIQQFVQEPVSIDGTNVYVNMTNTSTNPSGCGAANGFFFAIVDDRAKRMFATLTAAQLAGKTVQLYVTGACGSWGYAQIDGVLVQT
jgi:hypothetical protein